VGPVESFPGLDYFREQAKKIKYSTLN
jgi:hypothetical protein